MRQPGPLVAWDDSSDGYPKWVLDRETRDGTEQVAVVGGEDAERFATLFAASGDLLEAAKAAREVLTVMFGQRKDGPGKQAYEKLGAAIAKAGRS